MSAFNFIFPREGGNIKQPGVGGEVPDNLLLQYCFSCKKLEALDQDQHSLETFHVSKPRKYRSCDIYTPLNVCTHVGERGLGKWFPLKVTAEPG